jgi:hypothetical protein
VNQVIFPAKAVGETQPYVVNFSDRLQFGESINGAAVAISVFSGTDPNPNGLLSGTATYDAEGNVTQVLTAGLAGVLYSVVFTVTGTGSHNYVKVGQLAVVSDSNTF